MNPYLDVSHCCAVLMKAEKFMMIGPLFISFLYTANLSILSEKKIAPRLSFLVTRLELILHPDSLIPPNNREWISTRNLIYVYTSPDVHCFQWRNVPAWWGNERDVRTYWILDYYFAVNQVEWIGFIVWWPR